MQGIECYKHVEQDKGDLSGFVMTYSPLIKRIANHIKCRLPATIELDDLLQAGLIGLLEARTHFSDEGGAAFETYASIKIRGAMIDEVRRNTGITRDISQNMKKIAMAKSLLENQDEDSILISPRALSDKMGISEKKYTHMVSEINAYQAVSMNDVGSIDDIPCSRSPDPLANVERDSIRASIKALISTLPKREQQVLALYYNEQLSFKEIADILDLTEARISQIHSLSLEKIKKRYGYTHGE
ncbi:RNA polymerase sigma factor FliA [Legionella sp. CNM-4043-24]|uniref:RNA polymerase sigma factor FliA n=1 Tax=Legionella sp. CNM-4043-24 TaxID=3421646 RepID=UPI00403B31D9